MRKTLNSIIALVSLALVPLMYSTAPAAAKDACQMKAEACERRCMRAYKEYTACIYRTCVKQYGTCGR